MTMNRLLVLSLSMLVLACALAACESPGTCLEAPELPRAACSRAAIDVVVHVPPDLDDARLAQQTDEAAALLAPHGIDLMLVEHRVDAYWPYLDATTCDAFQDWAERIEADDGALHVWAMREIRHGDLRAEGFAQPRQRAIAILPHAQDGIMAHEIGHVLGLRHNDDPGDIMYPGDLDRAHAFTPEQGATMLAHACAW